MKMKIKYRMLMVFVGLALLVGIVGSTAIKSLHHITDGVVQVRESSVLEIESTNEMALSLSVMDRLLEEYIHHTKAAEIAVAKNNLEKSFAGFEAALELRKSITGSGRNLYEASELENEEEELINIRKLEVTYKTYKAYIFQAIDAREKKGELVENKLQRYGFTEEKSILVEQFELLKKETKDEIVAKTNALVDETRSSTNLLYLISVLSLVLGVIAAIFITRSIVIPVLRLKAAAQNMALGNMDIIKNIKTGDEIGDLSTSFNMMTMDLIKTREEIENYNKTLEQKVKERTEELEENITKLKESEERLQRHTTDLENSNFELEQFAYVAAHDLQEPLRTVSNFVGLFQKQYTEILDARAMQYLAYTTQAADRMRALIFALLEYSRIGANKELRQVDTQLVVQEVLADLDASITEAGAQITAGELPVIAGYPTEIKQLFQNLVTNAIKFRKKNITPQIKIAVEKEKGYWEFTVSDNGIGIAQPNCGKIFSIFQRLHSRKEYEGTGIGLSNCKKIVEIHKGKIWVQSAPGTGSNFHFTIKTI